MHHPPTNCGPSGKGAKSIASWLGAYDQPGRHWDVISFNHGHWDSKNDKAAYQANLEKVIAELKKTKANLIWVTTCPVPNGYDPAGLLEASSKAPGRTAGVMRQYLNPWALEVMKRHPQISICDQWQYCKDSENGIYKDWWAGKNVHFKGAPADALGQFLGKHVAKIMGVTLNSRPADPNTKKKSPRNDPRTPSKDASSAKSLPRRGIPMLKKDFAYQGKRADGLYDEAETAAALPHEWKNLKPLESFNGVSASLKVAAQIPDGAGGTFDIATKPSDAVLAALKKKFSVGYGLDWYFSPKEPRYRSGPGLTGDEILADLRAGKFPEEAGHPCFTYGFYTQNVTRYYRLYRISKDPYYVDQIVKYAEGVEWILANRPQQLIPLERRGPLEDPVATIPHEPIALANFWAHANAARLLLERARAAGLPSSHPSVSKAKHFLNTIVKYVASQTTADFQMFARKRGDEPTEFVSGKKTLALQKKFNIPNRAAQIIEYTPWNQSFFYFSTLAATAIALKDLQVITGGASGYQLLIDKYRNIVRAGIWNLEDENICVVREGAPYFFHMHTPLRDGESKMRLGFPMFGGEDVSHSGSGAWNLPYLWECGEKFGVRTALLAGYANAMIATIDDRSSINKKGEPWPRQHIDSPWYLAASGRKNFPFKGTKGRYYPMMPFAPEIVAADRPYARNLRVWSDEMDLNRLYAGYLYRLSMERRSARR